MVSGWTSSRIRRNVAQTAVPARPVLGPELGALAGELPLRAAQLVTQSEDLGVVLVLGHR